jgi:hypothetical protein
VSPKKSQLENLSEDQKKLIQSFDDETITKIYQSREVALKYAQKAMLQTKSEKFPEEIADYMQVLARIILEERGILGK